MLRADFDGARQLLALSPHPSPQGRSLSIVFLKPDIYNAVLSKAVSSSRQITRQGVYGDLLLGDLLSKEDNSVRLKYGQICKIDLCKVDTFVRQKGRL